MDGFVFILIFFFVILPIVKSLSKSANKASKRKNRASERSPRPRLDQQLAQINARIQQSRGRDTYGHSNARNRVERELHAGDTDTNVFTPEHAQKVKARERHDRAMRKQIEAALHSKKNRAIIRDGNKGINGWGERGDRQSTIWLWLILFVLIGLALFNQLPHNWLR